MEATSLKGIIQEISGMTGTTEIMQGTVIQEDPLQIQMLNDDLLIINDRITIVPTYLTDYTVNADFSATGSLSATTDTNGSHTHDGGTHDGHSDNNDGSHAHDGGEHAHELQSFEATKGTLTIYNALKAGDMVYVMSLNNGKKYLVLDRITAATLE